MFRFRNSNQSRKSMLCNWRWKCYFFIPYRWRSTAFSESYREELRKEKYKEVSRDLFLEMPLPTNEIIDEIKKRIGSQ
jgi:hypothetical protein